MDDSLSKLRRLDFPIATKSALSQLTQCVGSKKVGANIPGLGGDDEDLSETLVKEFIFYQVPNRAGYVKKLTAIQELQLLEVLTIYFQNERDDETRHLVFKALFGSHLDNFRRDVLAKLISMAIGVKSSEMLDCMAIWMQRHGCNNETVLHIIQGLVQDYCLLVPGAASTLKILPQLSKHFTCNFVTAVTCLYQPADVGDMKFNRKPLPSDLLEILTEWITEDPRLCLISLGHSQNAFIHPTRSSLWTSPTKSNTQTPIPGLVRWCNQAPLFYVMRSKHWRIKAPDTSLKYTGNSIAWSKLHLALLQTLQAFPTVPGANQLELITLADMSRIVKELVALYREARTYLADHSKPNGHVSAAAGDTNGNACNHTCIEVAVERVVQVLQVSLATGGFRCSLGDLQGICNSLPPNQLLTILQSQHLARTPPPMHHESR